MNKTFETYRPEGFGTVSAYLMVQNPNELIDFLKNAFYAEEIDCSINPQTGDIANVILKIGSSCLMISQARNQYVNMRTSFYLFVDNVDEMHKRAIEYGAKVEFEPANMPYEDRQSGVIDPSGNYWWISKRLVKKGYHES
jgi:uncharacterized glyoxalase superfamily protein PhnB